MLTMCGGALSFGGSLFYLEKFRIAEGCELHPIR
jgi:hypothetical protein